MEKKCIIQGITNGKEQYVIINHNTGEYELKDEDATLFDDASGARPGWIAAHKLKELFPDTIFKLILPGQIVDCD